MIRRGSAFDLKGFGYHLRVVVSEPDPEGLVLVCNITDIVHVPGCPCHIEVGEHERITKTSGVELRRLLELKAEGIERAAKDGHIVMRPDFPLALVQRISAAILASKEVPEKFKKYLR